MRRYVFTALIIITIVFSLVVMRSIAPFVFPSYLIYILISLFFYFLFSRIDFSILTIFWKHFYVVSIVLLLITLIIGQASRGVIRWIPIGNLAFQPSELIRPFLFVFFAVYMKNKMNLKKYIGSIFLFGIAFLLIVAQPSLGVAVVTASGFIGMLISSPVNKKYILISSVLFIVMAPFLFFFLHPYQKDRIQSLFNSGNESAHYNSVQSVISVGSGGFWGRGLGRGVQTQLAFLPERHTDFAYASISEELGFFGAIIVLVLLFLLYLIIIKIFDTRIKSEERVFVSGIIFSLIFQTFVHVGMNLGFLPITGLTLPLISIGGSSLLATMISLGILLGIMS